MPFFEIVIPLQAILGSMIFTRKPVSTFRDHALASGGGFMRGFVIHASFDVLAWLAAAAAALWVTRTGRVTFPLPEPLRLSYLAVLLIGAALGAVLFGSANLWLSGMPGLARSIEGGIAGGIVAIELYKRFAGITARTGARFALPFAVGVAVGRIGCFLSGIDDFTHGTPTTLPWGHD